MKLCKYQILSIMLHSVRAAILVLPLNIFAIWITSNREKGMSIIKLIQRENNLYYLTRQKNSWYKIKESQLRNYGIVLNLKLLKSEIS